ncbi:hypothetical protein AB0F92_26055 [Kitasatospora aureofaciens]|uniref:hypothetical protein n=1 Tax=Kitasatospora aureofaciens TaxID=1894 RepID=UPI00296E5F80
MTDRLPGVPAQPPASTVASTPASTVASTPTFMSASASAPTAVACLPVPPVPPWSGGAQPPVLGQAARSIPKATLVAVKVDGPPRSPGFVEHAYLRRLGLRPDEVAALRGRLTAELPWELLAASAADPGDRPLRAAVLAAAHGPALRALGGELEGLRRADATAEGRARAGRAAAANAAYDHNAAVEPIGMLNLERLEMAPAGIERGELVATVPLAPLEETAVTQKEWSVTSKEFSSIVTDSLENVSETGVTDNTELAQSTTNQLQHSNQFNVTGTVSGGISLISGSASSGMTSQSADSQSATDSRKHATAITQKASARTKQEHKVTITTTTVTGSSETTTRTLRNASPTDAVRIDYFSMMRKWRVRLYRSGLRLTYDLAIPEPAGALRQSYAELAALEARLGPFRFDVPHSDITEEVRAGENQAHYLVLAERYGAAVPLAPGPHPDIHVNVTAPNNDGAAIFDAPPLNVPDRYWIKNLQFRFTSESRTGDYNYNLKVLGSSIPEWNEPFGTHGPVDLADPVNGALLAHASGPCTVSFHLVNNRQTWLSLTAVVEPTDEARRQWQNDVWAALFNAAQTKYYAEQQDLAARAAALRERLNGVDTLTLRREESDEIMKGVLRFLLGVDYHLMPSEVVDAFKASVGNDPDRLGRGAGFPGDDTGSLGTSSAAWAAVLGHEAEVAFVNQAIEWENVVTFLYSYFWDAPAAWPFVSRISHPDANRQAFLRAGSARVVLTVRKGWEEAWVRFAEGGFRGAPLPADHPYLTIAREIAAYDDRNYPGIPPANPGSSSLLLEDEVVTTCAAVVQPAAGGAPVLVPVASSEGFDPGTVVVVDEYDDRRIQENATVVRVPDDGHLLLSGLAHRHDGSLTPFPVRRPGHRGTLIAEWNEYTPTSGTDIAVSSRLKDIA